MTVKRLPLETMQSLPLREKCLHSELFWSAVSRIRTENRETLLISPYLVRMRGNADQKNFRHFLRSMR